MPDVILVDESDKQVQTMEKMLAHEKGMLHRAFSIFIFDKDGRMLLQQRSLEKYHNGGIWSNACCSHPLPGEETLSAANRRLKEEMGFNVPLKKAFDFIYKVEFENGLFEHEFDHVFIGFYDGKINIDPAEVSAYIFRNMHEIKALLTEQPENFTKWFHIAFPKVEEHWHSMFNRANQDEHSSKNY